MIIKNKRVYSGISEKALLGIIRDNQSSGYIRNGTFSSEIIWNKKSFIFLSGSKAKRGRTKLGLYLFQKVRKEARLFLETYPSFKLPKQQRSIMYSNESDFNLNRSVCATDLNHAYWRIALNLKIISEKTYRDALPKKYKSIRLAALSTLGAGKAYHVIDAGKITAKSVRVGENAELKRVYTLIRYTCFKHMAKLSRMLGKDFLAYKTDCIYYYDTQANRKAVTNYFNKNNLTFKQLS